MYSNHPHVLEEQQVRIQCTADGISKETLKQIFNNMICHEHLHVNHNGQHIQ
jgi:hypothetical protein